MLHFGIEAYPKDSLINPFRLITLKKTKILYFRLTMITGKKWI
jgi:hypothetical protein